MNPKNSSQSTGLGDIVNKTWNALRGFANSPTDSAKSVRSSISKVVAIPLVFFLGVYAPQRIVYHPYPSKEVIDYLEARVGFTYTHSSVAEFDDPSFDLLKLKKPFSVYEFEVEEGFLGPPSEQLKLSTYRGFRTLSWVLMEDRNNDGECDYVHVNDSVNNTKASIECKPFGRFKFEGIGEEAGRQMFAQFSDEYSSFLDEHDIPDKVDKYSRVIEVQIYGSGS